MSQALNTITPKVFPVFGDLTMRQNSFVGHYLEQNGNGTKAAKLAGYPGKDNQLAVTAHQLIRNPKIVRELKRRLGKAIATPDEVLERLTRQARADLTDVLDENGQFSLKKARAKRILKKLKVKTTTRRTKDGEEIEDVTHEYEIHDPQVADERLGRFHRLFVEKGETELSAGDVERLSDSIIAGLFEAAQRRKQQEQHLLVASSEEST